MCAAAPPPTAPPPALWPLSSAHGARPVHTHSGASVLPELPRCFATLARCNAERVTCLCSPSAVAKPRAQMRQANEGRAVRSAGCGTEAVSGAGAATVAGGVGNGGWGPPAQEGLGPKGLGPKGAVRHWAQDRALASMRPKADSDRPSSRARSSRAASAAAAATARAARRLLKSSIWRASKRSCSSASPSSSRSEVAVGPEP